MNSILLIFVFIHFILSFICYKLKDNTPDTGIYFDRENQQVWSYSKKAHASVPQPYSEFKAHIALGMTDTGATTYVLHFINQKKDVLLTARGIYHSQVGSLFTLWELIQRIMDKSKPLPDVPYIEAYRELDPVTREFDKQNNRPKAFWRKLTSKKWNEIDRELCELSDNFKFDYKLQAEDNYGNGWRRPDWLEKPWLHFGEADFITKEEAQKAFENRSKNKGALWQKILVILIVPDIYFYNLKHLDENIRKLKPHYLKYFDDETDNESELQDKELSLNDI